MSSAQDCPVCLQQIRVSDRLETPCHHRFHRGCIQEWTKTKKTCPICRSRIVPFATWNGTPLTKAQVRYRMKKHEQKLETLFPSKEIDLIHVFVNYYNRTIDEDAPRDAPTISIRLGDPDTNRLWVLKKGIHYTSADRHDITRILRKIKTFINEHTFKTNVHQEYRHAKRITQLYKDTVYTILAQFFSHTGTR